MGLYVLQMGLVEVNTINLLPEPLLVVQHPVSLDRLIHDTEGQRQSDSKVINGNSLAYEKPHFN